MLSAVFNAGYQWFSVKLMVFGRLSVVFSRANGFQQVISCFEWFLAAYRQFSVKLKCW